MEMGRYDLSPDYDSVLDEIIDYEPLSKGGLVIGQAESFGTYTAQLVDSDSHTLTIGSTRSGKTRHLVIPSIVLSALAGECLVITDIKGELFHYLKPFLVRLGYEVIARDYINPEKSDASNEMQRVIDALNEDNIIAAKGYTDNLVQTLVGEYSGTGERIWTEGEKAILACCIMAVAYDNRNRPEYQNFNNVYHFIARLCKPVKDTLPLESYLNALEYDHPAKGMAAASDVAHVRTRSSFYAAAIATLRIYENPLVAHMSSRTDYDNRIAGENKRAIFILLPEERGEYYPVVSLFVYQYTQILIENARKWGGRLQRRVNFFMDEAGNFTKIINIDRLTTLVAGRGIRFHFFLHGINQLKKEYGDEVTATLSSNCETWVYLKTTDPDTLNLLNAQLGNYTVLSPNLSVSSGTSKGSSSGYGYTGRALLTTDEISLLNRPHQLVMGAHHPAICISPNLNETRLNSLLGLGDEVYNINLIMKRFANRPTKEVRMPEIWDIAKHYSPFYADLGEEAVTQEKSRSTDWIVPL